MCARARERESARASHSTLDALVEADARSLLMHLWRQMPRHFCLQEVLALALAVVMLAYLRSPAFLALALAPLVGADARPQALLARALAAIMLAYLRSLAFFAPCTSSCLMRLWGQMPDPRHSLHLLLTRSCSHICDPMHSLHVLFSRLLGLIRGRSSSLRSSTSRRTQAWQQRL